MKINEITVSYGRTLQIKQFEPMTFHFSAKAELSEKDNVDEAYADLKKIVEEQLGQEIVQWENPQMVLRRMQQEGADKYVDEKAF